MDFLPRWPRLSRRTLLKALPWTLAAPEFLRGRLAWADDPPPPAWQPTPFVAPTREALLKCVPEEVCYVRVPIPEAENAYPLIVQAISKLVPIEGEEAEAAFDVLIYEDGDYPTGEPARLVDQWLEANRPASELLAAALQRGKFQFPESHCVALLKSTSDSEESNSGLDFLDSRNLARVRLIAALRSHRRGDFTTASQHTLDLMRFGRIIARGEGVLVDHLVGNAIWGMGLDLMRRMARDRRTPASVMEVFWRISQEPWNNFDDMRQTMRVELCSYALAAIQKFAGDNADLERWIGELVTDAGASEGDKRRTICKQFRKLLEGHPQPFDWRETATLQGKIVAESIPKGTPGKDTALPPTLEAVAAELTAWPKPLQPNEFGWALFPLFPDDESQAAAEDLELSPKELETARRAIRSIYNPLGKLYVSQGSAYHNCWNAVRLYHMRLLALRISLATRRWRDAHGELPESLDQLVAAKLVADPLVDPVDGQPLQYSREQERLWRVPNETTEPPEEEEEGHTFWRLDWRELTE